MSSWIHLAPYMICAIQLRSLIIQSMLCCCCSVGSSLVSVSLLFGLCSLVSLCSCSSFVMCSAPTLYKGFLGLLIYPSDFVVFFQDFHILAPSKTLNVCCMHPVLLPFLLVGQPSDLYSCLASSLQVYKSTHICSVHLVLPCWILSTLILQNNVFLESLRAGDRL